jgi:hypothetical protein
VDEVAFDLSQEFLCLGGGFCFGYDGKAALRTFLILADY